MKNIDHAVVANPITEGLKSNIQENVRKKCELHNNDLPVKNVMDF